MFGEDDGDDDEEDESAERDPALPVVPDVVTKETQHTTHSYYGNHAVKKVSTIKQQSHSSGIFTALRHPPNIQATELRAMQSPETPRLGVCTVCQRTQCDSAIGSL